MAKAFVLDTTLDPAFELAEDDEKQVRNASLALPAGNFVVFAKVEAALYGEGLATFRLGATYSGFTGVVVAAEDKSTVGLFVEYVEGEAVLETVSLSLAAHFPWGGFASVFGSGTTGAVNGVKITALQVDDITLTTHHEAHVSDWHPR